MQTDRYTQYTEASYYNVVYQDFLLVHLGFRGA